jgi:N-acyl-D-aspartate/D-glutamate deacylase
MTFDLVIRGAVVYDGLGTLGRLADVGVREGRIAAVGKVDSARETFDAHGLALMPGIVDLHTHYDAQVTWDPTLSPSPSLGVTTAVMGNCGFGIAPCPAGRRDTMVKNLSVVEGMDLDALQAGTRWEFESFAEYMALLRRAHPYANLGVFAQHSTIRTAVMGEAASTQATPTPDQLARMQDEVRAALGAGAIGFASSFSPNHSGHGGLPMPSTIAGDAEIHALAGVLGEAGRGVFMMATGPRATPEFMEAVAAATRRPAFISTVLTMYNEADPGRGLTYYEKCGQALARGNEVYIQTSCQPLSFDFTLEDPYLLLTHSAFDRVSKRTTESLADIYRDPAFRAQFRSDLAHPRPGILFYGNWAMVEVDGVPVTRIAAQRGIDPLECFFDVALENHLATRFVAKLFQNDDAGVAPLLRHPNAVVTLSDAGAHLIFMCDAGFGLHFLRHWVRETGTFTLEAGVKKLTSEPAARYRIPDRGRIAPGVWADLLLFDPATVGLSGLVKLHDLPGGGSRMIRRPEGVAGVWVNGVRVFDGKDYVKMEKGPGQVLDRFDA